MGQRGPCQGQRSLAVSPQVDVGHEQGRRKGDDLLGGTHEVDHWLRRQSHPGAQLALRVVALNNSLLETLNVYSKWIIGLDSCFTKAKKCFVDVGVMPEGTDMPINMSTPRKHMRALGRYGQMISALTSWCGGSRDLIPV